jgi:hypothetical protein
MVRVWIGHLQRGDLSLSHDPSSCGNGCTVDGTTAAGSCLGAASNCRSAISAMYASTGSSSTNTWGFETGNEGWDMGGDWSRDDDRKRGGWSADFWFNNYANNQDDWNKSTVYNLSTCSSCTTNVHYWVKGSSESGYDYLYIKCTGNNSSYSTLRTFNGTAYSSTWGEFYDTLPSGCLGTGSRIGLHFTSDGSVTDDGYVVDDIEIYQSTNPSGGNGWFDYVNETKARGWACHSAAYSTLVEVHAYFDRQGGGTAMRVVTANQSAEAGVDSGCGGTPNHRFDMYMDPDLKAWLGAGSHNVRFYGVIPGNCGGGYWELSGSPKTWVLP